MKISKRKEKILSRIELLSRLIPNSIVRISVKGAPHVVIQSKYSVCYFASAKIYKIWDGYGTPGNKKIRSFKTIKEVVEYFNKLMNQGDKLCG
jgi:hypothetical protein